MWRKLSACPPRSLAGHRYKIALVGSRLSRRAIRGGGRIRTASVPVLPIPYPLRTTPPCCPSYLRRRLGLELDLCNFICVNNNKSYLFPPFGSLAVALWEARESNPRRTLRAILGRPPVWRSNDHRWLPTALLLTFAKNSKLLMCHIFGFCAGVAPPLVSYYFFAQKRLLFTLKSSLPVCWYPFDSVISSYTAMMSSFCCQNMSL